MSETSEPRIARIRSRGVRTALTVLVALIAGVSGLFCLFLPEGSVASLLMFVLVVGCWIIYELIKIQKLLDVQITQADLENIQVRKLTLPKRE
jgi:hypothetical protein